MAAAACSALTDRPLDGAAALTGEVGLRGEVHPVGGVPAKIEAARRAGLKRVLIPRANWLERFAELDIEVIPVDHLEEAIARMFQSPMLELPAPSAPQIESLAAKPLGEPV
jgi:Lon-like ATP-dependent protease